MLKNNFKYLFLALFLLQNYLSYAQLNLPKFTVAQLQEDFKVWRFNLENVHAGLYYYTPKSELDAAFDAAYAKIDHPMDEVEFHRLLTPILPKIANGHTIIVPSKEYFVGRRTTHKIFPFLVYYDQGAVYLLKNYSDEDGLQAGDQLLTINGMAVLDIFNHFVENETRDGSNLTLPQATATEAFSRLYAAHFGNPDTYQMEVKHADGKEESFDVAGLKLEDYKKNREKRYGKPVPSWMEVENNALLLDIEDDVATMTIRTFSPERAKKAGQKFKPFYKKAFAKIKEKNVQHLIIDMRQNGGGDPMPTIELFSYLYDKPVVFYRDVTAIVRKLPNPDYYDGDKFTIKAASVLALRKRGDVYAIKQNMLSSLAGMKGMKPSKPKKNRFDGEVYVLIDAGSFSATGEMAGLIKNYDRAVFIGEETGGNSKMNVSGFTPALNLPNTKVRTFVSMWMWEMNVDLENEDRGIIPDHPVRNTIQDELSGRDAAMEFTLDLIEKSK